MSNGSPVTLITGASAGIGEALAQVFASHGHDLVLTARREAKLSAVASAIADRGHSRPHILALDLAHADAPARIEHELSVRGFAPQYVVNNAGFGLLGAAATLDRAEQLAMIDLNARALTDLSLRFVPSLVRQRGGILNVASVASFMPGPGMAVYHATKAYVLSLSEALHRELQPSGVRVTALCPGPVPTEFQGRAGVPEDHFPRTLARTAGRVAEDGYNGLMQGRRLVIPGFDSHVAALLPRLLPRGLVLRIVQAFQRGHDR